MRPLHTQCVCFLLKEARKGNLTHCFFSTTKTIGWAGTLNTSLYNVDLSSFSAVWSQFGLSLALVLYGKGQNGFGFDQGVELQCEYFARIAVWVFCEIRGQFDSMTGVLQLVDGKKTENVSQAEWARSRINWEERHHFSMRARDHTHLNERATSILDHY